MPQNDAEALLRAMERHLHSFTARADIGGEVLHSAAMQAARRNGDTEQLPAFAGAYLALFRVLYRNGSQHQPRYSQTPDGTWLHTLLTGGAQIASRLNNRQLKRETANRLGHELEAINKLIAKAKRLGLN